MLGRNVNDSFAKSPTPHFPRSRFDMGIRKRLQTQGHGRLYPFFCRFVYPGDTWQMDMTTFVRMDTSLRVPLDDIFLDTYWFFIPIRIIDENFAKVLGEGEPSDYDDVDYEMPVFNLSDEAEYSINNILPYLGYNQASATYDAGDGIYRYTNTSDEINPYSLAAYYKVYNDWFRDENLDASIPFKDLYGGYDYQFALDDPGVDPIWDSLNCLKVNRYHDYFSSAMIAPQKGPAQTIPLGTTAPVGVNVSGGISGDFLRGITSSSVTGDGFSQLNATPDPSSTEAYGKVVADLSKAAGTINELRLAFAIQALYERRGRFGTRYIETIRGQWGIEVPDSFFQRPEYLGGNRVTLNNVPVLSTENSSQLGQMSGNSSTLSNGGSWSKTFIEYGILLGVSCTRIKHSYTQGKRKELFGLKTALDLYNPVFANIGAQPILVSELYNDPEHIDPDTVFAYEEAWSDLRTDYDSFAGKFGTFSTDSELKNKWHYGDYYASRPYFSAEWLKEPYENVARTLTGQLINGAGSTEVEGHQFMFGYYYHPVVTRILPSHSVPVELIGRL